MASFLHGDFYVRGEAAVYVSMSVAAHVGRDNTRNRLSPSATPSRRVPVQLLLSAPPYSSFFSPLHFTLSAPLLSHQHAPVAHSL